MASTGARSTAASYRPVRRFVEPGPTMAKQPAGSAGELALGRCGEGGGPFVTDADVPEVALLDLAPEGICEPEVGVARHPEDGVHPQATMVSAKTSETSRRWAGSGGSPTHTSRPATA